MPHLPNEHRMSDKEIALSTLPTKVLLCSWKSIDGIKIPDEESLKSMFHGCNTTIRSFDSKYEFEF